LLVFLGIGPSDDDSDIDWMLDRLIKVRLFEDATGKMNQSLVDTNGSVLLISQFTLYGSLKKGNRPSFNRAAPPGLARDLYEQFAERLSVALDGRMGMGRFGEHMEIDALHDGPVTLFIDTKERGI